MMFPTLSASLTMVDPGLLSASRACHSPIFLMMSPVTAPPTRAMARVIRPAHSWFRAWAPGVILWT